MGYTEKEINTIVKKSLALSGGFGFKIADPPQAAAMTAQKNPFDGFGVLKVSDIKDPSYRKFKSEFVPMYWESKFIRELSAFSLKRIEDHQAFYLNHTLSLPETFSVVPLGIYVKRGEVRVYLFEWASIAELYAKGFSFHKKFLELLPYNRVTIKTGTFSVDSIITKETILKAYGFDVYAKEQDAQS